MHPHDSGRRPRAAGSRRLTGALLATAGLLAGALSAPTVAGAVSSDDGKSSAKAPYQNAKLPVERRVEDLLGRMTLKEKAGDRKSVV